ncbi:MAG: HD domain-containing phosphohydrolase [Candidatus Omnitrophota bacterium]
MLEKIENSFRELIFCLQTARLYPNWHPEFKKSIDKAYLSLEAVLKNRETLVIGLIGEELAFEKEIFFELSKTAKPAIAYLKSRGVEKIEFFRGLKNEELSHLITILTIPKEELQHEPQEELFLLGVEHIVVGKIKGSAEASLAERAMSAPEALQAVSYLKTYDDSLGKITNSLEKVLNDEAIDSLAVKFTVSNVLEGLVGRYQEFLNFATVKRYDTRTFCHMINVCILSMFFSSRLGFAKEEVLDIGVAALFHDIGKLYISRKILQKPERLTDDEFTRIKSHVIAGGRILLKYVPHLGVLPVVVSFEHHLKYDLSGYPKLTYPLKPHIASQIVCICDVYDALSQRRNYKNDYPPKMIYEIMMKEKGTTFNPELVQTFFKFMGVWPVGTLVALNDSSVAVIREINESDIFSPKVEILAPGPGQKKGWLDLKIDQGKRIDRYLNPLTDGKAYLAFV